MMLALTANWFLKWIFCSVSNNFLAWLLKKIPWTAKRWLNCRTVYYQKWITIVTCWTGNVILSPGSPCGSGLSATAARQLGLQVGTPVATSIIDAHAGGLGMIGCSVSGQSTDFSSRLGRIFWSMICYFSLNAKHRNKNWNVFIRKYSDSWKIRNLCLLVEKLQCNWRTALQNNLYGKIVGDL